MSTSILREDFRDFDLFRDVLLGWDVDVTQLSPGPLHLRWHQVVFDNQITLSHLISNRSLSDRMAIDHGWITFVVCFTPNIFCGIDVSEGSLLTFGPGREYRSILPKGFETFEICASIDFLRDVGLHFDNLSTDELSPEQCVLSLSDRQRDEFRRLSLVLSELSREDQSDQMLWTIAVREQAINLIVSALQQSRHVEALPLKCRFSSWLLVARALDHIDKLGSYEVSVTSVSKRLGCSTRALQIAFKTVLGITPLQYILARRLQLIRSDLIAAKPNEESVSRIAAKHEFFHFGRFSQYYRALFGEKPSDTLKKSYQLQYYQH